MSRTFAQFVVRSGATCFACVVMVAAGLGLRADETTDRIDAHLSAGEFAAALRLVDGADAAQRDQLMQRVAAAQDQAGARRAADATLQRIADDRIRADAVDYILAQRFGSGGSGFGVPNGGAQRGGESQADFEALIELITKTIEPDSWDEVGGPGSVAEFETGVVVDAAGVLRRTEFEEAGEELRRLQRASAKTNSRASFRKSSPLRKISLPRLERAVQIRMATGGRPDEVMRTLAGLSKIQYIMVFPESGDLVIAGPAGDWRRDRDGRMVSAESGRPVLQLDDLVVVLRSMMSGADARFGCSITPTKDGLARTKAFLAESSKTPLAPGRAAREKWLEQIRSALGRQDIDVYGVDPGTRVGQVIVEADYRMKLVGMGLEPGTAGVTSYLDAAVRQGKTPTMDVLRWWFTLNYDSVQVTPERNAYEIRGQGVQVLSENEMITLQGERVHTGKSDELNRQFSTSFTREFPALATKYPIYAELQNVFDLALVAAIFNAHDLPEQAGWHMKWFLDPDKYQVATSEPPRQTESVISHRLVDRGQIIAGVSGGVRADPYRYVNGDALKTTSTGQLTSDYRQSKPQGVEPTNWWWD